MKFFYQLWSSYPELAVPAGYDSDGQPVGVVFVGKQFGEKELLILDMRMNSSLKIDDLLKYRVDKVVFRKVVDKKIRQ